MPTTDLNSLLYRSSDLDLLRVVGGSRISTHANLTSNTVDGNAQVVTVPGNAVGVWVGHATLAVGVFSRSSGAGTPLKDSAGRIVIGAENGPAFFALDPEDLPSMFVQEEGADTALIAVLFITR